VGKKQHKQHRTERDRGLDKPSFAADVMAEPVAKKEAKPVRSETDISVEEHLKPGAADKLAALKVQMLATEQAAHAVAVTKKQPASASARSASAQTRLDADPDASFAELFDPAEEDEESFEHLLEKSKTDWRHFK